MASLCARVVLSSAKKSVLLTAVRCSSKNSSMPDPVEHATGLEKRELLAKLAGNENPFDLKAFKRGPGTKDTPNLIPSAFESRIVGCICDEDSSHVSWMWLHQAEPKRCGCGHWFKLIEKAPV